MVMSDGAKERLTMVIDTCKTVVHYGFIPFVLYLGFRKGPDPGMPQFSLLHMIW